MRSLLRISSVAVTVAVFAAVFSFATVSVAEEETLHQGKWTKKTQKVEGTWKIIADGGKRYVVLDEKFKTKKAPDLKIFFSPAPLKELSNKTALKGSTKIAKLKSRKGAQKYEIPASVDLSQFKSLIIHCEKYTKLWGAAALVKP